MHFIHRCAFQPILSLILYNTFHLKAFQPCYTKRCLQEFKNQRLVVHLIQEDGQIFMKSGQNIRLKVGKNSTCSKDLIVQVNQYLCFLG